MSELPKRCPVWGTCNLGTSCVTHLNTRVRCWDMQHFWKHSRGIGFMTVPQSWRFLTSSAALPVLTSSLCEIPGAWTYTLERPPPELMETLPPLNSPTHYPTLLASWAKRVPANQVEPSGSPFMTLPGSQ